MPLLGRGRKLLSSHFLNGEVDIRLIGRNDRSVGIGAHSAMFEEGARGDMRVQKISIRHQSIKERLRSPTRKARIAIYTDVLENWAGDPAYKKVRGADLKIAYVVFDSDRLPPSWVDILNREFDLVLTPSEFVKSVALQSGCKLPVFVLPLEIPDVRSIEKPENVRASALPVRFLSIGSYHSRKNYRRLVQAFTEEFGPHSNDVQLTIHSNLSFSDVYDVLRRQIEIADAKNIFATRGQFHPLHIAELFEHSEVYVAVSKGEGFCIPAREAALRGKIVVATDGSALQEVKADRMIRVPVSALEPARYTEIDNAVFGRQFATDVPAIRKALRQAYKLALAQRGKKLSFPLADEERKTQYEILYRLRSLLRPVEVAVSSKNEIGIGKIAVDSKQTASSLKQVFGKKGRVYKRVIVGHDGGFFSLFNIYLSHLVWGQGARGVQYVLPDWNVESIRRFHKLKKFQSFCYGGYKDKNIWARLFESPYADVSVADLDNSKVLYEGSSGPEHSWNAENEPNLTYIHAGKLYLSPDFQEWRKWYHAYYSHYIRLKPHIARRVDELEHKLFGNAYVISAHIRHPSHAIEQPNGRMAEIDQYLFAMEKEVERQQRRQRVKIFVATDQEKVIKQARQHFGSQVVFVSDIARVNEADDAKYEQASEAEKRQEGFQVQHLTAADEKKWSVKMAEEVIVDAMLLSRSRVMFHTVSNVATAVSFMNPLLQMNYLAV